jgi:CubicO group peptidase (beta-lactamase class C family)
MKEHTRACIAVVLGVTLGTAAVGPTHAQTFAGSWSTSTDKVGWFYDMTLTQTGANVTGNYTVTTAGDQQGTKGDIKGTVSGSTLKLTWNQETRKQGQVQANAFTGTAEFTLCADNNHFMGTYTATGGPALPSLTKDLLAGTWIGTKKGTAPGVQDKLATGFKTWLSSVGVTNASLAVMQKGCLVGQYGFGNRRTTTPVPVASLTKAITAMCIANLVDGGKLSYTDKVSDRLKSLFTGPGVTIADNKAKDITIANLLRHQSGFPGGVGNDPVVPPWAAGVTNTASADQTFAKAQLAKNLDRAPGTGTWAQSHYNNVNFALLGMIIAQVTGQSYEAFCRQAVLTPSRFHGYPVDQPRIGTGIPAMGAFGGWEITMEQYADFIDSHYRRMSAGADKFMSDSLTSNADSNGIAYGLGVVTGKSRASSTRNYWHFGNWPGGNPPAPPTTPQQFSSYFALWDNDLLAVAALDQNKTGVTSPSLDCAMLTAQGKAC